MPTKDSHIIPFPSEARILESLPTEIRNFITGTGGLEEAQFPSLDPVKEHLRNEIGQTVIGYFLLKRDYVPSPLFEKFAEDNPSFSSKNTVQVYVTRISKYLIDWMFHHAELPVRYKPLMTALDILESYRKIEQTLPLSQRNEETLQLIDEKLTKLLTSKWERASVRGALEVSSSRLLKRSSPRTQKAFSPSGIAKSDQALLGWLLSEYKELLGEEFWRLALSNRAIGVMDRFYEQEEGHSNATRALTLIALSHFKKTIEREYSFTFDEQTLKPPRIGQTAEVVHEVQDLRMLLEGLRRARKRDGDYLSYRNEVLCEILIYTGIRASEIVTLQVKDYEPRTGKILIRTKGGHTRRIPIARSTQDIFGKFLSARSDFLSGKRTEAHLFVSRFGKPLTRISLYQILHRLGSSSRLPLPVTPHSLRRSAACALLDNGAPLCGIQQVLGHKNLSTTMEYLSHGSHTTEEILRDFHPLSSYPSKSLRATASRERTRPDDKPARLDLSNRDRAGSSVSLFKEAPIHGNPGFLLNLVGKGEHNEGIIESFFPQSRSSSKRENTRESLRQYRSGIRHYLVHTLHRVTLPVRYYSLARQFTQLYLADRLDWLVRTGVVSIEPAKEFVEKVAGLSERNFWEEEVFRARDKGTAKILKGVNLRCSNGEITHNYPLCLHHDPSSKNQGIRLKALASGLFGDKRSPFDVELWKILFHPRQLESYFREELDRGVLPATLQRQRCILRAFGEYLKESHEVSLNGESIVNFSPRRNASNRPQKYFTEEEVQKIIGTLRSRVEKCRGDEKARAAHNLALVLTLYSTACRPKILEKLRVGDIDFTKNTLYVNEKSGREFLRPLFPEVRAALIDHLRLQGWMKRNTLRAECLEYPLFFGTRSYEAKRKLCQSVLNEVGKSSGVQVSMRGSANLSARMLRTSAAIHMAHRGATPFDLKKVMGHASLDTTSRYLEHGRIDVPEFLDRFLPDLSGKG